MDATAFIDIGMIIIADVRRISGICVARLLIFSGQLFILRYILL